MKRHIFPFPELGYAETHFKFKLPWSPLFRRWPEIFIDAPRLCIPGVTPPVFLVVKDADYFPVKICEVQVTVQHAHEIHKQILPLEQHVSEPLLTIPLDIRFPERSGRFDVNAKITAENKKGKKITFLNTNLTGILPVPMNITHLDTPLPYPPGWLAGEPHCHSSFTNNPIEFGAPLQTMRIAGRALGLGYIVTTDHSWDFYYRQPRYMQADNPDRKFAEYRQAVIDANGDDAASFPLMIPGEEVSCGNHLGQNIHLLVTDGARFLPGQGDGGRRWLNNRPEQSVQEIMEMAGDAPMYAAHPKIKMGLLERTVFRRGNWHETDLRPSASGHAVTGLQFWNGHRKRDFSYGRAFWVQMLLKGHRLLPMGADDAHGDFNQHTGVRLPLFRLYQSMNHVFGTVRTVVESPEKSVHDIKNGLKKGNQIATDGPFLNLRREGDRIEAQARSIPHFGAVDRINLFSGKTGDAGETVVKQFKYPEGPFDVHESVPVDAGISYYRAEIFTKNNHLAICSPVWVE